MARPKKLTVDYFPHIIKQGKTMTILENRFGNDGYAFWFKLLEILGTTEGHSYRYENITDIEFLLAKTKVDREIAENILDLLSELGAIDKKLWENKIIWSDNFIDNVADVYNKRSTELPQKPVIDNENSEDEELSESETNVNDVFGEKTEQLGEKTPQSKLKKSKLKKSKLNKRETKDEKEIPSVPYQEISDLYNKHCPNMTKVIKVSDRRKEHLKARWKEIYKYKTSKHNRSETDDIKKQTLSVFEEIFQKAGASKFMNGRNNKNWQADFDWMIKNNSNYTKVLEGKYDNDRFDDGNNSLLNSEDIEFINTLLEKGYEPRENDDIEWKAYCQASNAKYKEKVQAILREDDKP